MALVSQCKEGSCDIAQQTEPYRGLGRWNGMALILVLRSAFALSVEGQCEMRWMEHDTMGVVSDRSPDTWLGWHLSSMINVSGSRSRL
jgi:hypothetical protein